MEMENKNPLIREGSAYDSLASLFDAGTFVELSAYAGGKEGANAVCGYGAIEYAPVFAFAQDFSRNKGAFGTAEAEKICALYDMAKKSGAPVVGIFSSAGARIDEGNYAMSAFGKVLAKINELSGIVPQIAVIDGICAGMSAVAASMFDVIVASEKGSFYMNPPFILKNLGDKEAGTVKKAAENGLCDIVCADTSAAIAKVRELLCLLPQNNSQGLAVSEAGDDLSRSVPELEGMTDPSEIAKVLSDCGRFEALKSTCAPEVVIGLAPMGNTTTGIVATASGATLTPKAARKISGFLSFCDNFMIPVLTLVDTKGVDLSVDAENAAYASELSRLASAYAASTNAKVTVVLGKAYGAAYTLLGSKAMGADVVYATEDAVISVMEPDAAVQFLYGDEIKTPEDRKARKTEWLEQNASAVAAAVTGDVDDVIAPADVRAKVVSAFQMLWAKADDSVSKKHSKLPF